MKNPLGKMKEKKWVLPSLLIVGILIIGGAFALSNTSNNGDDSSNGNGESEDETPYDGELDNNHLHSKDLYLNWNDLRTNPSGVSTSWEDLSEEDKDFLKKVEREAFGFFWNEVNPETGLIQDRATNPQMASIASVGFGLSTICVAEERGWISYENAYDRVLKTLNSFYDDPEDPDDLVVEGSHGFFYHFVESDTGNRYGNCEISLIDTAILAAGVLHAGNHFKGTEIETLANEIYKSVEWDWLRSGNLIKVTPNGAGKKGYDEYILSYLLALGSPTHPVTKDCWDGFASGYKWVDYENVNKFLCAGGIMRPLAYLYQFPACWIDFRGKHDEHANYWQTSINALKANRIYCIKQGENYGYPRELWGWTASDGKDGYRGYGAHFNGTISPSAVAASVPFVPEHSISSLKYMYEKYSSEIWREYGFVNAFNPNQGWYDNDYIGIDQGNLILMLEGFRSGSVWSEFMQIPYVQEGLEKAGFRDGFHIDEEGFIRDWLVAGPFGNGFHESFSEDYIGETSLENPKAALKVGGKTWQEHHSPIGPADSNYIDLWKLFSRKENVCAYAYTEVTSEVAQKSDLKVGSDDAIKVWVNDELVHSNKVKRGAEEDQDLIEDVSLEKGTNKILVKVCNSWGGWGFYFRIT